MKPKALISAVLFAWISFAISAVAASDKYRYIISAVSTNDGLSNNTVQAVLQDHYGFVWFGTKDGLDRFDGSNLRHFTPVGGVNENNYVLSLCEDNWGKIWVGTSAGLCVFNPETEEERCFNLGIDGVKDIEIPVYQIIKDNDGSLWIPAGKAGFIHIFPENDKVVRLDASKDGLLKYYGSAICHDGKNSLYFIMDDGNIYHSSNWLESAAPILKKGTINYRPRYLKYAFGRLFTGSAEEHIVIDLRDKSVANTPWSVLTSSGSSNCNELWVADELGISILDNELKETFKLTQDFDIPLTLQGKSVISMCEDSAGGVWVGTFYAGAFHLVKNRAGLHRYYPRSANDILGSHVRQILPEPDGVVWICTEDNGLVKFLPQTDKYYEVDLPFHTKNIQCVCSDRDYLWIGSFSMKDPLARMNKKTGHVDLYADSPKRIYSLCRAEGGSLLIGHAEGLSYLKNGKFHSIPITGRVVHEVMEDSRGDLWVSSGHDGLWHCRGVEWNNMESWEQFSHNPEDQGSLSSNIVTSAFEDSHSRIWVTTESGGFCCLDQITGKFKRYSFPTSFKISEDAKGLLWITTIKGLLCFNPQTEASHMLTREDGMLSNQYNYSSNVIGADGILYAGSVDGFILFDPLVATQIESVPRIVLSSSSLGMSLLSKDKIVLKYSENSFNIGVSTVNSSVPRNYYLMYNLSPVSDTWQLLGGNGIIEFKNLESGKYTLKIHAVRLDGTVETGEKSLRIEIQRPFFASTFAIILYILLSVVLILVIRLVASVISKRQMREEKKRVEAENEKNLFTAKFDFVTKIAHEIKTPLSLIRGPLEDIKEKMSRDESPELLEDVEVAYSNTERLHELVGQLLDFSAIERVGYTTRVEPLDIAELTKQICNRFSTNARSRKIKFETQLPNHGELQVFSDKDAFDKIVSNLISNAIKYGKSFTKVSLNQEGDMVRLVVENDGIIIPASMREEVFKPFVRYSGNSHVVEGTGIGLATSRTLAAIIGGTLYLDETQEVNRFILLLPINVSAKSEDTDKTKERSLVLADEVTGLKRVLVVEDNPDLQKFIMRKLSDDYQVFTAVDGVDAQEKLESHGADIIVSDIMMPRMNGFELCQVLKENIMYCHIPIILLTAKTDVDSKIQGMKFGADMYIEKPFSVRYLISVIDSIVFNRELLRKHYLANPLDVDACPSSSGMDSKFLKLISDFIYENISDEGLMVKDIASATCMSESNLFRKTKELLGMSPNEYLQFIRLKAAAQILATEKVSIADVCIRVGFASHSYFSNCFKKQFGVTPNDYRNSTASEGIKN